MCFSSLFWVTGRSHSWSTHQTDSICTHLWAYWSIYLQRHFQVSNFTNYHGWPQFNTWNVSAWRSRLFELDSVPVSLRVKSVFVMSFPDYSLLPRRKLCDVLPHGYSFIADCESLLQITVIAANVRVSTNLLISRVLKYKVYQHSTD